MSNAILPLTLNFPPQLSHIDPTGGPMAGVNCGGLILKIRLGKWMRFTLEGIQIHKFQLPRSV